ncbi:hypothetical protein AAFF_G00073640 [Aldrovandia affinis]|uniref:Reverse transcriptase n=1 Tax=Aldrovandia affinis TaxID=143900 RepID=A0AAD7RYU9_9TELE|nr:hypothetical protein AAFF_G00073640 [Aldrovandia affinis]
MLHNIRSGRKPWQSSTSDTPAESAGASSSGAAQKPPHKNGHQSCPTKSLATSLPWPLLEKSTKKRIRGELRLHQRHREDTSPDPFEVAELEKVLQSLKYGKAAGYDNIALEFMKHLGSRALAWLTRFYTVVIQSNTIPKKWRTAKVIAIPNLRKDLTLAASYHPICLLSVPFKIFECLNLQCISPTIK